MDATPPPRVADPALPGPFGRAEQAVTRLLARLHPVVLPTGVGALGLAGAALLHFVDPGEPGNYPTCPWLALTGTYCPGCGSMRAVALLTHLDITAAISMNPLLFLLAPFLVWTYAGWFARAVRPSQAVPEPTPTWFLWAVVVAVFAHWILRNLPWFAFLAPGAPLFPGW
ncbi:DUF2752 domain-containing protein [Nocardiopsis sp. LOL_012]|uniref:DUF2752 domain-containing protein n=1 Tax=Nocardiopsis sp. LOL_012 TaxID=3345409 RepID=UPI003A88B28A